MKAAILGATGLVGQRFVQLLNDHGWFEIVTLTGSERTSGVKYGEAVNWRMETPLKKEVAELTVQPSDPKSVDWTLFFQPCRLNRRKESKRTSRDKVSW